MYEHSDLNDPYISLHDCRAEKMYFSNGVLSFVFPDGFWITQQHPKNKSKATVRTDLSQVDFQMIEEKIDSAEIFVFRKNRGGKVIREGWEPEDFINAVNAGDFQVEFITRYQGFESILFKCWVWLNESPYHQECEIVLDAKNAMYHWNKLRYDFVY